MLAYGNEFIVRAAAVTNTKLPRMPRADQARVVHTASRERCSGMGAGIVEHGCFRLAESDNAHSAPVDFGIPGSPDGDVVEQAEIVPTGPRQAHVWTGGCVRFMRRHGQSGSAVRAEVLGHSSKPRSTSSARLSRACCASGPSASISSWVPLVAPSVIMSNVDLPSTS